MKAGIAAAVYAAEAIRRAGVELERIGRDQRHRRRRERRLRRRRRGWPSSGRLSSARSDYVIIPEPLNVDRICIGHRGVYWFEVETHGRIAHGSMPFLGVSAIEHMGVILDRFRRELLPALSRRTTAMPVVPDAARHATLNINGIAGGQPVDGIQTPCVADVCRAVFDRRFLLEEGFDAAKAEIVALLERVAADTPELAYELRDLMVVHPVRTPDELAAGRRARARRRSACSAGRRRTSRARAPTITSTSIASAASATASPTARASSISRISRTSGAASTIWSTRRR